MKKLSWLVSFGVTFALAASALGGPQIGVFPRVSDAGSKGYVDQYETWLGRPVDYIVQFPPSNTWAHITGSNGGGLAWWVGVWRSAPQSYRDRMVISLAMLPGDGTGTHAAGATGAYDVYWKAVAQRLVDEGYGNCMIRPGWEFTGTWYPWKVVAGQETNFKNHWIHLVDSMRSIPGANFKFCWNPTAGWLPFDAMNCYPEVAGKSYVDFIGIDIYDISSQYNVVGYPGGLQAWDLQNRRSNAWMYQTVWTPNAMNYWAGKAAEKHVPLCIPEWGLDTPLTDPSLIGNGGRDNPYFIQKMSEWINMPANNVAWASYFEWGYGTDSRNHSIFFANQYPLAKALFPTLFGYKLNDDFSDGNSTGWTPNLAAQWLIAADAGDNAYKWDYNWTNTSGLSTVGDPAWTNYEVSTEFKITETNAWSNIYLYARYVDANNYYRLAYEDQGAGVKKWYLQKRVAGTSTTLGVMVNATINLNTWYDLALDVNGSTLTAYLDGVQILQRTDTAFTAGKIGLGGYKEDVLFDNVIVK